MINSCDSSGTSIRDHNWTHNEMKMCLKHIRFREFPVEWEKNISDSLSKKYRKKYFSLIQSMFEEAKDMYIKDMHYFTMKVVLSLPKEEEDSISTVNYTNSKVLQEKRTNNYNLFLKHRKLLSKKYFLSLQPVRFIVNTAQLKLPTVICNFDHYYQLGLTSLDNFQNVVGNDIKKGSLAVTNQFYTETSKAVAGMKVLKNIGARKLPRIMQCVTNVFVQQILNLMIKSIDHILQIMSDGYYCPQIKLQLIFQDNRLHVSPSIKEVYAMYHSIIDDIGIIAQDLIPLEEWLNMKTRFKHIKIRLPDWYIKESHDKLQSILCNLFEPINKHMMDITEEFYPICALSMRKRILSLTLGKVNFDLYLKQIQKYKMYLLKANGILGNTYYSVGKLEQNKAKDSLKKESYDIVSAFLIKLVTYHQEFNLSICSEFEDLKTKALNVSKDAKSLIDLTEYISYASDVLIKELECKIQKSINMLTTLLEITVLSEEHIKLNERTVNWLHEIEPVFRENNTLCEVMKNELEDDMQRRMNNLNSDVGNIIPQLDVLDRMNDINRITEYVEYYRDLLKQVNNINSEMQRINEEEQLFKFPETEFPKVIELREIIIPFYDLLYIIYQWQKDNAIWLDGPFEWLDADVIERKTLNYYKKITETSKVFKTKIKMDLTVNKCFKFSGIADDPDPMQQPAPLKLCWQAVNSINDFIKYLPLVTCMCNPALQERHWKEMSLICNFDLTPNAGTSLKKIISCDLMGDIEKYEAISISATRELRLQQKLSKMIDEWDKVSLDISFDEKSSMHVFSNLSDIEVLLEDHFTIIEEMKTSSFVKPIISKITDFFTSLVTIQKIINQWNYIQVLILSLDSTFSYAYIEIYLPEDSTLYAKVKEVLANIQTKLCEAPTFAKINNSLILECLCDSSIRLEKINHGVRNYIEAKRLCFPRFFFLSDKEIQNILFESNNSEKLHVLLNKCFEGIEKVRINEDKCICSVIGNYGEVLHLENYINVVSNHEEKWLISLESEINTVITKNIFQCWYAFSDTFMYNNIANFPSMVVICIFQLYWSSAVHNCFVPFNSEALKSVYLEYVNRLTCLINEMKGYSTKRHRDVLISLIIIVANQRDVIKLLLDKNLTRTTDFEWAAQLRYYLEEDYVKVSMFDATIKYGCEYNYYKQCIINTTLTDRCFHTLMQAYKYHLYGAVRGQSVTGKTETFKSLAKAIAVQFRIFNCVDIASYTFLCQIFRGFVSCGAWLCFKNFDRLKVELISTITQSLISISQAVATNQEIITLEGSTFRLNPMGNICIITNLGLFKHCDLPDNLKILFRTVSMMSPDINRIVEIELFAAGLSDSKLLASKLNTLYKILSEQLWCKSCNIFNICYAKAIVRTISYLKRSFPNENESMLLLHSIIDINLPKLCNTDILIFKNIVHNMFPGTTLLPPNYTIFSHTVDTVCESRSLHVHDTFKLKIIQVFELMYVHRALILFGHPLVGKTEILYVLVDVLAALHKQGVEFGVNVKLETVVPGAANANQLFGSFADESRIWRDGICSKVFRSFLENDSFDRKWIAFDGPLNDVWIESLYTVLDTNKALHLASGEKIIVMDSVSIIFETMNMVEASPAILSRCGMIYIESNSIDWRPYVKTHISKSDIYNGYEEVVYLLLNWAMDPSLEFIRKHCTLTLAVGQLHCVLSTVQLLEIYLKDTQAENSNETRKTNNFMIWIQAALISSIIWGLGANLDTDSHVKFNSFCTSLWSGTNKEHPKPEIVQNFDVTLPNEGLIQDNFYIFKGTGNWKYWGDLLKSEKMLEMPDCNEIFVPTINTMKYNHVLLKHVKYKKPFLLCGDVSIGKTYLIKNFLRNTLLEEQYLINLFSFTFLTTVTKTQELLLSKLNKLRGQHYGPPKSRFGICFIDDLNIETNEYKSEVNGILELLRQYHSHGYLYDTTEPEQIFIHDIMFSLAIIVNAKTKMCPRFLRYFSIYTMDTLPVHTLFRIFSNVLLSNLKRNSFAADVLNSVTSITNATIDIYSSLIKTLRPIPAKFQYQFSIRDISKVINGCSLLQKESLETKVTFIRLWAHEVWRVFGDRILDNDDKDWLFSQIRETTKYRFKDSFETAFDYLPKFDKNQITRSSFNNLMFSNFMDSNKDGNKRYEEVNSMEKLKSKICLYLKEYNDDFKKQIDIVVSQYVLECLVKVSRILATPGGNLLMISSIGSGRKSITSLAAYIQQQELFEPSVYSYCDLNIWRNDLKTILRKCGGLGKSHVLFAKDKQMTDNFLRDIGSLLASGEVPDLFSINERHDIIQMVRLRAQGGNRNVEISMRSVMNYFLEQCKNKLHIVICFNSTNKALRSYLHTYPELAKYCTINWYETWPTDALTQIGSKYIEDINVNENIKIDIIKACIKLYNNAQEISGEYYKETSRTIYIALSAFLHMLRLYTYLLPKQQKDIVARRNRYLAGLGKLKLAAQQVEKMKAMLTMLKPQLELSAQQTMITMKEVENENITVERATVLVQKEEEIANKKAEIAGRLKMECEADLAVAIPILEDAVGALNTLKPTDITLVKAMKNPPDTVKLVMAAVCVMLDVPPDRSVDPVTGKKYTDYWSPSKRILGDMNFLQNLKDYDKDNIPPNIMQIIKNTYIADNNFKPHIVAKASSAAEGLCKWVRAMVSYDEVAKAVAPKKGKLLIAQRECNEAEAFLSEKRRTLSALNAKLAALNSSLQETLEQKLKLEKEVDSCSKKLNKAENLIASLGSEKNRWMQCAENLEKNYNNLVGDMIISCGIISYAASYNATFRYKLLDNWKRYMKDLKLPFTTDYDIKDVLGEENEINHWYSCGLPRNEFSVENVIIMNNSQLWCLFIDSHNQANQWIKIIEKKNDLKVIRLTDSDYVSTIECNIENGNPVLIENVGDELEILLDPFLLKRIYNDDGISYLDTGYNVIKYSPDFRLYITTRLSNPQYPCATFNKVTVIDFSIPNEALQDRLLDLVVSKEKPELQEKFNVLLIEDTNNKRILKQQEDNILCTLSSTNINILEDERAIQILDSSKNLSLNVTKKQEIAKILSLEISKFRDSYKQFVKYCVDIFNTLDALSYLNHMYCFSFAWFMQLYIRSIETSNRSTILERRLGFLKSSFTQSLHLSICRSLSEGHKILYSFLLCSKILLDDRQTTEEEIKYFISPNLSHNNSTLNNMLDWLPSDIWGNICSLSKALPAFDDLADNFSCNDQAWKQYYNSEHLQNDLLPEPWVDKLSVFQKLILTKTLRPDRIIVEIMRMIEDILGNMHSFSPQLKVSQSYTESSCLTPLLFILPSCSSVLSLVSTYAKTKGHSSKFISLSMGKGQEAKAELLVQEAQRNGNWVLLQNCHLVTDWMIQLERICENCNLSNVSLNFRLWLSSYPTKEFPISILQNSIKITHDYPLNIKETLLNIYHSEPIANKEFFEGCPGKDKAFTKLLFGLCLFHTVIRERKSFGPQGWNVPYDFDHSDLCISIKQMQNLINSADHVPLDTLLYFIGECNYGGQIVDDFDNRHLKHTLSDYCNLNLIKDHQYTFPNDIEELIPQRCEYSQAIKHIEGMPLDLSSQVYGCSKNGVLTRNTIIAKEFLSSLSCVSSTGFVANNQSPHDRVLSLIDDINKKLCGVTEIDELQEKYTPSLEKPLERVLLCETKVLKHIVKDIIESLNNLKLAFNGYLPFCDSLNELIEEMYNNKIPQIWRSMQDDITPGTLACYVDNLVKRINFIKTWMIRGHPKTISLDALYFGKMFFSAISLTFSKRYDVAIEDIIFDFEVIKAEEEIDAENVDEYYIHGLHLVGARWDVERNMLAESLANTFWQNIPPIRLKYLYGRKNIVEEFECPVYGTAVQHTNTIYGFASKNYIISVPLKTDMHPSHWIKCGTALYSQIS